MSERRLRLEVKIVSVTEVKTKTMAKPVVTFLMNAVPDGAEKS